MKGGGEINNFTKSILFVTLIASLAFVPQNMALPNATQAYSPLVQEQVGARALGLGGAYVAVSDGFAAPLFNPAGVTRYDNFEVGGANHSFPWDLNTTAIAGGTSLSRLIEVKEDSSGTINSLMKNFSFGGSYITSSMEVRVSDPEGNPMGKVQLSENIWSGTLGVEIPNIGGLGASIKNYNSLRPKSGQDGEDVTISGIGLNLGLLSESINGFRIGAAGFDVGGTNLDWQNSTMDYDITGKYSVGGSYTLELPFAFSSHLLTSGQYTIGDTIPDNFRIGIEMSIWGFAIRGGYYLPGKYMGNEQESRYSIGAGIRLEPVSVDAALIEAPVTDESTIVFSGSLYF